jgi:hypothetical protein
MSGDEETTVTFKFTVKGIQSEAEIVLVAADIVRLRIDPKSPWDAKALRHFATALGGIALTLSSKRC